MPAKNAKYTYGDGSRKAATATARLYKGKGEITINNKPALEYLSGNKTLMAEITDPLAITQKQKEYLHQRNSNTKYSSYSKFE